MSVKYKGQEYVEYVELQPEDIISSGMIFRRSDGFCDYINTHSEWIGEKYKSFTNHWRNGKYILLKEIHNGGPRRIPLNPSFSEELPLP